MEEKKILVRYEGKGISVQELKSSLKISIEEQKKDYFEPYGNLMSFFSDPYAVRWDAYYKLHTLCNKMVCV